MRLLYDSLRLPLLGVFALVSVSLVLPAVSCVRARALLMINLRPVAGWYIESHTKEGGKPKCDPEMIRVLLKHGAFLLPTGNRLDDSSCPGCQFHVATCRASAGFANRLQTWHPRVPSFPWNSLLIDRCRCDEPSQAPTPTSATWSTSTTP